MYEQSNNLKGSPNQEKNVILVTEIIMKNGLQVKKENHNNKVERKSITNVPFRNYKTKSLEDTRTHTSGTFVL